MGKHFLLAITLTLSLTLESATVARGQGETSANFLGQAFNRVTESASGAAKLGNFGYQEGISILGGWIRHRDSLHYSVPLTKDVTYMFVAGGDNDAENVDIEIQDADGNPLEREKR